jgi:hypothetical protein
MKEKVFSALLAIGLFICPASAIAAGTETNEPEHSITGAHEGFDVAELLAAGSAIILAVGIAFTIGRRSRKKD